MANNYFEITTSENIPKLASKILTDVRTMGDRFARTVAEIFVERAQEKLASAYPNTSKLIGNIYFQRTSGYANYRIGFKPNKEKEIMFYLEFGTGLVGEANPHPKADEFDWFYVENPVSQQENGPWVYRDGEPYGWYYFDEQLGTVRFTRGLKAVRFMWDTMQEMDEIKLEAKRRMKDVKPTLPRRRIIRK